MSSVITKLSMLEKVTRCRGQHRQHSEPGQTLGQAGNKPEESTLTSQVQYRALATGLWRIISAMQHTSEHNTSVEIRCMCIANTMLAATIAL